MRPLWGRILRRVLQVGIPLAIIGHLLGRALLHTHRTYGGGAYNPENERALWQAPAIMAGLGIAVTLGLDFLYHLVRQSVQTPTAGKQSKT